MAKVLEDTNQGTPSQGDSYAFPFFGNVGAPLMATLNILGLNVGRFLQVAEEPLEKSEETPIT
jgi:hypothetical protein